MSARVFAPRNAVVYPISPKQLTFIGKLRAERGLDFDPEGVALFTSTEARHEIDRLLALPKPAAAKAEAGYYVTAAGEYVVVVQTRDKQRTYAKRLVLTEGEDGRKRASWDYAPGVAATLANLRPMALQEAAAFGHLHGTCLKCLRPLTDPESVERGIGPVCARSFA